MYLNHVKNGACKLPLLLTAPLIYLLFGEDNYLLAGGPSNMLWLLTVMSSCPVIMMDFGGVLQPPVESRIENARHLTRPAHSAARVKASLSQNSNRPACSIFELIAAVVWASAWPWVCTINRPLFFHLAAMFVLCPSCSSSSSSSFP